MSYIRQHFSMRTNWIRHCAVIFITVSFANGCQDVLDKCYNGDYGYKDPKFVPLSLHSDVIRGNSSGSIGAFCGSYSDLQACVKRYIVFCLPGEPLWEQWTATVLLNDTVCTSTTNLSNALEQYNTCINTSEMSQEISKCNNLITWDSTSYQTVTRTEGLEKRCIDYEEKYQKCMKDLVANRCLGIVSKWFERLLSGSYFLQVCHNTFGSNPADCPPNQALDDEKKRCKDVYNTDLYAVLSDGILGGDYITKSCFVVRKYAKCELDAIAVYCSLRTAEKERQRLSETLGIYLIQFDCRIADVIIAEPVPKETTTPVPTTTGCETITISLCTSQTYNLTKLPNHLRHRSQDAAELAMYREFGEELYANCSPLLACFVCILHVPICSGLPDHILPCRSLCETVQSSCGDTWSTAINCKSLPTGELCFGADSCNLYDPAVTDGQPRDSTIDGQPRYTTIDGQPRVTDAISIGTTHSEAVETTPVTGTSELSRDVIIAIAVCLTAGVIVIVAAVSVVCTKRMKSRPQPYKETINLAYVSTPAPLSEYSKATSSTSTGNYDKISGLLLPITTEMNKYGKDINTLSGDDFTDDTTWDDSASQVTEVNPPSSVQSPEKKIQTWLTSTNVQSEISNP